MAFRVLRSADVHYSGKHVRIEQGEIVTLDDVGDVGRAWLLANRYVEEVTAQAEPVETPEGKLPAVERRKRT